MTHGLQFESPLSGKSEVGSALVRLADWSGRTILDLRGQAAFRDLTTGFASVPRSVGEIQQQNHGLLVQLRHDRWLYIAQNASRHEHDFADRLGHPGLTDISHGYGILHLGGPHAQDVLGQACGLDFGEKTFPDRHAAQTSLARVAATIVRIDDKDQAYLILVERSVAAYIWYTLADIVADVVHLHSD